MTPDRWREIERLTREALERPTADRTAFVRNHCEDDEALAAEVDAMLDAYGRADDFLDRPIRMIADAVDSGTDDPKSAGGYSIVRELGRGGMSRVFLASRDDGAFEKRVAVKLIKRGLDTHQILERFRQERQILADLEHPGIARLIDGGSLSDGRPFLVMELVEGETIDRYCDAHRLSIDERLALVCEVCLVVHHAHQNLVVHRDLKPSNIMVTPEGRVKLLDFGVAKLLDPERAPTLTGESAAPMTPVYASPEQVHGGAVSTLSDVFSLGIVLYELVGGRPPSRTPEAARHSSEAPASAGTIPRLSAAILDSCGVPEGRSVEDVARLRSTTVVDLRRRLSGDLETIVSRALAEDAARRYPSVLQLAEDLQRYRQRLPVLARPDSALYRLQRFVARHRVAVAASVLLAAVLFAATIVLGLQAAALAEERDRVVRERDRAHQVTQFFSDVFSLASPEVSGQPDAPVRAVLDRGITEYEASLADLPDVRATVFHAAGDVYRRLGEFQTAEDLLRRGLAIRRTLYGEAPEVAESLMRLSQLLRERTSPQEAEDLMNEALRILRSSAEEQDERLTEVLAGLAWFAMNRGDLRESEALILEALELDRRFRQAPDVATARDLTFLGHLLRRKEDLQGAEERLFEAREIYRATLGLAHVDSFGATRGLAMTLARSERHREAIALYEQLIKDQTRALGENHPALAYSFNHLAQSLSALGKFSEAEKAARRSLAIRQDASDPVSMAVGVSWSGLGEVLSKAGRLDEAELAFRKSLDTLGQVLPAESPQLSRPMLSLARILLAAERLEEAEALARQAVRLRTGGEPIFLAEAQEILGRCLLALGREVESAEELGAARASWLQLGDARADEVVERIDQLMGPENRSRDLRKAGDGSTN